MVEKRTNKNETKQTRTFCFSNTPCRYYIIWLQNNFHVIANHTKVASPQADNMNKDF